VNDDDDNLEQRLATWLEATARPMPVELRKGIVGTVSTGARAAFPSGRRWQFAIAAVAATVVVAIAIGSVLRLQVDPVPGPPGQTLLTGSTSPPAPAASPTATATATTAPPASFASPGLGEWHRNNYNEGEEQLTCREATDAWTCYYEIPDGSGRFNGDNVTEAWVCPEWFPSAICDNVVAVYHGIAVYSFADAPTSQPAPTVSQDYIVTSIGGRLVLQLYWVEQSVCPWYRTLETALAEEYACLFAPGIQPPKPT